jgi:hypothetical protein
VNRVFIGMESINPDALKDARKGQNQITEYRAMLQAWHGVGALTYAGYILGFPGDTPASIERDIGIIQRELPIDLLEFFILTPLPGSADHKKLHLDGVAMDTDMNKYDLTHVTTAHPKMASVELAAIYRKAWDLYYTPEHVEQVIRRSRQWGYNPRNMMTKLLSFYAAVRFENVHPLEGGLFRRKHRRDRRSSMTVESPFIFYPAHAWHMLVKHVRFARMYLQYRSILKKVLGETSTHLDDAAMAPVHDADLKELELFSHTPAAQLAAIRIIRKREQRAVAA